MIQRFLNGLFRRPATHRTLPNVPNPWREQGPTSQVSIHRIKNEDIPEQWIPAWDSYIPYDGLLPLIRSDAPTAPEPASAWAGFGGGESGGSGASDSWGSADSSSSSDSGSSSGDSGSCDSGSSSRD